MQLGRDVGRFLHFGEGAPSYNLLDLVQPQLQPDLQAAFFAARQQGRIETRRASVTIGGAVQQIDVSVQPITEPAWARDHWLVQFQELSAGPPSRSEDLIERRQAEKMLRLSEERYRTLFESIDEGFCILEMIFDADNGRSTTAF